jgi:hypothetical protein
MPLLGALMLTAVFFPDGGRPLDPAYGSASSCFGLGSVFVIGTACWCSGAVLILAVAGAAPGVLPRRDDCGSTPRRWSSTTESHPRRFIGSLPPTRTDTPVRRHRSRWSTGDRRPSAGQAGQLLRRQLHVRGGRGVLDRRRPSTPRGWAPRRRPARGARPAPPGTPRRRAPAPPRRTRVPPTPASPPPTPPPNGLHGRNASPCPAQWANSSARVPPAGGELVLHAHQRRAHDRAGDVDLRDVGVGDAHHAHQPVVDSCRSAPIESSHGVAGSGRWNW